MSGQGALIEGGEQGMIVLDEVPDRPCAPANVPSCVTMPYKTPLILSWLLPGESQVAKLAGGMTFGEQ